MWHRSLPKYLAWILSRSKTFIAKIPTSRLSGNRDDASPLNRSKSSRMHRPQMTDACRSTGRALIVYVIDFVPRLQPEYLQSFCYFPSKGNFTLGGTLYSRAYSAERLCLQMKLPFIWQNPKSIGGLCVFRATAPSCYEHDERLSQDLQRLFLEPWSSSSLN